MRYHTITIFPELFVSFLETSLIAKAQTAGLLKFSFTNPRDFCVDIQKQVDDALYGGGAGLLMKAQPIIDALNHVRTGLPTDARVAVIMPTPAPQVFTQQVAHTLAEQYTDCIFICGRYEGIDHRVVLRCQKIFGNDFYPLSLGSFVTLGGELPAMVMIEAVSRLLPGVIKESASWQNESYRPELGGENLEHPQYTRPEIVEGMPVPEVLLGGNHAVIEQWKRDNAA